MATTQDLGAGNSAFRCISLAATWLLTWLWPSLLLLFVVFDSLQQGRDEQGRIVAFSFQSAVPGADSKKAAENERKRPQALVEQFM